jgi:tetratricopeptide (TPR) repeat protein
MKSVVALAAAAILFLLPAQTRADTVDATVLQAESLSDAGKNTQALAILNRYLASHPQDARALVDRGDVYQTMGQLPESIADYTAALVVNPEYAYAYASRGDSYNQIGNYTRALADADKALALRPKYGYALRVRSVARLHTNDLPGAQDDAHAAIEAEPNSAASYATACRMDRTANQPAIAKKECLKALQIDPTNYRALFELGRLQVDASDWADVDATFSKVLTIEDGDDPGSNYWRAEARYNLHRADEALSDINIYLLKNPDDGDAYYLRAQIDQQRGDLVAAKKDAASALAHYGIDNDTEDMKRAQALLDQLNAAHS